MGSSRCTERVTTVVAAICIGAALTGPMIAFADPESDSPSRQSDSSNDANSRFSLPTFVGLARLPTFVGLVRLTRFHLVGIDRERGEFWQHDNFRRLE